jgi:hypothetical protein
MVHTESWSGLKAAIEDRSFDERNRMMFSQARHFDLTSVSMFNIELLSVFLKGDHMAKTEPKVCEAKPEMLYTRLMDVVIAWSLARFSKKEGKVLDLQESKQV